jgi:L-serine dehydratase
MPLSFDSFAVWQQHCADQGIPLYQPVLEREMHEKGTTEEQIFAGLAHAYQVMKEAAITGATQELHSLSGMVQGAGRQTAASKLHVISPEFTGLIAQALSAKETNACMGRVVAAPTAGASGILPGYLTTLQALHNLSERTILEGLLVSAGTGLIIQRNASLAGAVGGCQAETGSAAAMAAAAGCYMLGGSPAQAFNAVAITIQCMLGLICDPVGGLVEIPCIVRNASAVAIAASSTQIALAGVDPVIPADECVTAMAEVGMSMETRYKETALGGLAATPTARRIMHQFLGEDLVILDSTPAASPGASA